MTLASNKIDIIIPVHNQRQLTIECIESVIETTGRSDVDIVVIDDASTDDALRFHLRDLSANNHIHLIEHTFNFGFVRSVNEGMRLNRDRDIILLNSDTVVYGDWVTRLWRAAYKDARIGTSNPLTNFGGSHIAIYPRNDPNSELDLSGAELDAITKACNAGRLVHTHTTVGFCMFIKRNTLNEIGYFDEKNFPRAYGEESDFCYRASYAGWKHVIATDVFVSHFHGKSFGDEKKLLMAEMLKTFEILHPHFASLDADFRSRDPLKPARCSLDLMRLTRYLADVGGTVKVVLGNSPCSSEAVLLSLDSATGTLSFLVPSSIPGLCDLPVFQIPRDIVFVARTMDFLGVRRIIYDGAVCRDAILALSAGEPHELDWSNSMQDIEEIVSC